MKNATIALLFSIAVGVASLSGWRYVGALRDRLKAEKEAVQFRERLAVSAQRLAQEVELRDNLVKEKLAVESSLKESQQKVEQLASESAQEKEQILSLVKEINDLRQTNSKVQDEKAQLEQKLGLVEEARTELEVKFHSLAELKKAIHQLRLEMRNSRSRGQEANKKPAKIESFQPEEGNLGFLFKNGLPTYKPKLKIEVSPAQ